MWTISRLKNKRERRLKKEEEGEGEGEEGKRDVRNTLGTSRYESEVKTFLVLFFGLLSLA